MMSSTPQGEVGRSGPGRDLARVRLNTIQADLPRNPGIDAASGPILCASCVQDFMQYIPQGELTIQRRI
jgi:hypothetical protein